MSQFDEDTDLDFEDAELDDEALDAALDRGDEIDPFADESPGAEPWAKTSSGDADEL